MVLEGTVGSTVATAIAMSIMTCLPYLSVGFTSAFFENSFRNENECISLGTLKKPFAVCILTLL